MDQMGSFTSFHIDDPHLCHFLQGISGRIPDAVEVDLHWKTMDGSNVGWFLVFDVFFSTDHTSFLDFLSYPTVIMFDSHVR